MSMIETSLIGYLTADADIAEAIGAGSPIAFRIYPEVLKQETCYPAITYTIISGRHDELLDGSPDLKFMQVQFSCWGQTFLASRELAALVRIRMIGIGGSGFQKAGILDERSDYEPDTKLYRTDIDIQIAYAESSPA